MIIVRDILEEIADHVGGTGVDIDCSKESENKALKVFNESQRLLMNRGDFEGTDKEICLQVSDSCITLDRRIETIKQYTFNGVPGRVHNDNFKYLQQWRHDGGSNKISWYCGSTLEDAGDHYPLIQNLDKPMYIAAYSDRPECDSYLSIYGADISGRELSRHYEADKGFKIPIKEKDVEAIQYTGSDTHSSGIVSSIDALRKTRTNGYVYVYGYLPHFDEDGTLEAYESKWLVTLAPDETNSIHRRYRIPGFRSGTYDLTAKVSMRWVKQFPGDIALIQNIDAFILMAKALNARDDDEIGMYQHLRNAALSELKQQRAKKHPANSGALNVRMARNQIRNSSTKYLYGYSTLGNEGYREVIETCPASDTPANESDTSTTTPCDEPCELGVDKVAGEAIPARTVVYIHTDGKIRIASPTVSGGFGLTQEGVSEGGTVTVQQSGLLDGFTGLTEGAEYYLGASGVPTTTIPTSGWVQFLGTASSETGIILELDTPFYIE